MTHATGATDGTLEAVMVGRDEIAVALGLSADPAHEEVGTGLRAVADAARLGGRVRGLDALRALHDGFGPLPWRRVRLDPAALADALSDPVALDAFAPLGAASAARLSAAA